jgi:hypothetical protein
MRSLGFEMERLWRSQNSQRLWLLGQADDMATWEDTVGHLGSDPVICFTQIRVRRLSH